MGLVSMNFVSSSKSGSCNNPYMYATDAIKQKTNVKPSPAKPARVFSDSCASSAERIPMQMHVVIKSM